MSRPRRIWALIAAALLGCGPSVTPVAPAVVPGAPAAPKDAAAPVPAPPAADRYAVHGTLLGADGAPLSHAEVHLDDRVATADATGAYRLIAPGPGFYPVHFTGVNHQEEVAGVLVDGTDPEIDATLGTYPFRASFGDIAVVLFGHDNSGKPRQTGKVFMDRQADGTYEVELDAKGDEILYELDGIVDGRSVNGTHADGFEYDGAGDYLSRIHVRPGKVTVKFDPRKIPAASPPGGVRFGDPASRVARMSQLQIDIQRRAVDLRRAFNAANTSPSGPAVAPVIDTSWRPQIAASIASERDPDLRAALLLTYLSPPDTVDAKSEEAKAMAAQLLDAIKPGWPLWRFAPHAVLRAIEIIGYRPEHEALLDQLIDSVPDRRMAAGYLLGRRNSVYLEGRPDLVTLYEGLIRTKLGDTFAVRALESYLPKQRIAAGKELPEFDLAAFTQDAKDRSAPKDGHYRRASLKGKVTLIDFWGTWCSPCMEEMKYLHAAHDRYGRDGRFTILSIAIDDTDDSVRSFRKHTWKMPWHHAVLTSSEQDKVKKLFEVYGIPSLILVDADGKILAVGSSLIGDGLEKALAAALSKASGSR